MIPGDRRTLSCGTRKPRASGDDPAVGSYFFGFSLVNPARAGMIPAWVSGARPPVRKPRASGDDPTRAGQRMQPLV